MKNLKYISILLIILSFGSCNTSDEMSLQEYYVTSEKNSNYLMVDIPMSTVSLADNASKKAEVAYNSINKVNLLAFKVDDTNQADFEIEKQKVAKVLKNPKFTELMRINQSGVKIVAKYLGTEKAMDEVIIYVYDKTRGFALARVLGNDMKPENMMELLDNFKGMNENDNTIKQLKGFFGS